jgi:ferric-dicitrate binding protein FerR (iron transport regulator)
MRYPSPDQLIRASDEEIARWYEALPEPTNDLDRRRLILLCTEHARRRLKPQEPKANDRGCTSYLLVVAVIAAICFVTWAQQC